jgi:hypothetical protein
MPTQFGPQTRVSWPVHENSGVGDGTAEAIGSSLDRGFARGGRRIGLWIRSSPASAAPPVEAEVVRRPILAPPGLHAFRFSASASEIGRSDDSLMTCSARDRRRRRFGPSRIHARAQNRIDGGGAVSWTWPPPSFAAPNLRLLRGSAGERDRRTRRGRQSPSRPMGIQPERACHRAVTRLYPPLARKRDRDRRAGPVRPLLSSADFVSFRAPIDSVMDLGGQPRRPTDLLLPLRRGFGPSRRWKTR